MKVQLIKNFKIDDKKSKENFLSWFLNFLEDKFCLLQFRTFKRNWILAMELTDSDYESYRYEGNLRYNIRVDGESLSEKIREILN